MVTAGSTVTGIDAALAPVPRGTISGTVTAAAGGTPIANVQVNVYNTGGTVVASGQSAADGTYGVPQLLPGSYLVGFVPGAGYQAQFYNGQPSLASATSVLVSGGATTGGINAALLPVPPSNTAPPAISGLPAQAETLTEIHGAWTGNPTSYSLQWEDCDPLGGNCVPISGATSQTYVLTSSDVGHTIRAEEIAKNLGGSSPAATSSPVGPVGGLLSGVAATSATNAWAVGATKAGKTLIERWNGSAWKQVTTPTPLALAST